MSTKYILRLDDACETMDHEKWKQIEILLEKYDIKPFISVIPNNKDSSQLFDPPDKEFWESLKNKETKGWEICMHGNTHVYHSASGGLNPVQKRSEFAGIPIEDQLMSIRDGIFKFQENGFNPRIFVAPSHTFDKNTLLALESESNIRIISDTFAFYPYRQYRFIFIPQQMNNARKIKVPGIFTFCYHPSMMNGSDFVRLENFLKTNASRFINFNELKLENLKSKRNIERLFSSFYFLYRKYSGQKNN